MGCMASHIVSVGGSGALLSSKKNQNFKSVDRNLI